MDGRVIESGFFRSGHLKQDALLSSPYIHSDSASVCKQSCRIIQLGVCTTSSGLREQ